ncbi:hypothetical protein WMY93_024473 [Mugilogobius chulae]|uniref:Uncharacterized protein n=1 Tax=Mugilogobius chulae TaxID=88201 RepID=A0AAW0N340_9GOBI
MRITAPEPNVCRPRAHGLLGPISGTTQDLLQKPPSDSHMTSDRPLPPNRSGQPPYRRPYAKSYSRKLCWAQPRGVFPRMCETPFPVCKRTSEGSLGFTQSPTILVETPNWLTSGVYIS